MKQIIKSLLVFYWCVVAACSSLDEADVGNEADAGDEADVGDEEIFGVDDLTCSTYLDCDIKTVPSCCGTVTETGIQCVNKEFIPSSTVDCSASTWCNSVSPTNYCVCEEHEIAEGEIRKICQGRYNSNIEGEPCIGQLSEFSKVCKTFSEYLSEYQGRTSGGSGTFQCSNDEGDSLDVIWSASSNESPPPVLYFSHATGELLAVQEFSDYPQFCGSSSTSIWYGSPLNTDCDVDSHRIEIPLACYHPWTDETFVWSSEECLKF